jgi:hypothetical protein
MATVSASGNAGTKAGNCWYYARTGCLWFGLQVVWLAMLAWGLMLGRSSLDLYRNGATTTGTVIRNQAHEDEDGVSYKPVVQFEADGATYTFTSGNSTSPPAYRVGQEVKVRYDPSDPRKASIDNLFEMWLAPGMLSGAALMTAVLVNGIMFVMVASGRRLPSG